MPTQTAAHPCPPKQDCSFPYQWNHANPAAFIGVILCVVILLMWRDRNSIYLKRRNGTD